MEETTVSGTDTNSVRTRLLEAARSAADTPDPFTSITLAEIAAQIGKPESSILYQIEPQANTDSLTIFRQQAYVRLVERFETGIDRVTHEAVVAALAAGRTVAQTIAVLAEAVALRFRTDPVTPYLLGARARTESNPDLAITVESVWAEFASSVVDLIQLVLAAHQQSLGMDRSTLHDLARTAIAAGWMQTELVVNIDHAVVELDGACFEQTGLVLWTGIRPHLSETDAA